MPLIWLMIPFKLFIMWPNFIYWTHCYLLPNTWQAVFFFFFWYWLFFMKVTKYLTSWNLYYREEKKINSKWITKLCNLSDGDMYHVKKWIKEGGNGVEMEAPIWNRMIKEGLTKKVSFEQDPNVEKNSHVFV